MYSTYWPKTMVGIEVLKLTTFCKWIWGSYRAKLGRTIFQILFLTLRESVYCWAYQQVFPHPLPKCRPWWWSSPCSSPSSSIRSPWRGRLRPKPPVPLAGSAFLMDVSSFTTRRFVCSPIKILISWFTACQLVRVPAEMWECGRLPCWDNNPRGVWNAQAKL